MNAVLSRGVIRYGRVEVDSPIDLPDGSLVTISRDENGIEVPDDWDDSPAGVDAWLKWYDSLEPLIFSPTESAAIESDRQARKEWDKAQFDQRAEDLQRMWD